MQTRVQIGRCTSPEQPPVNNFNLLALVISQEVLSFLSSRADCLLLALRRAYAFNLADVLLLARLESFVPKWAPYILRAYNFQSF